MGWRRGLIVQAKSRLVSAGQKNSTAKPTSRNGMMKIDSARVAGSTRSSFDDAAIGGPPSA